MIHVISHIMRKEFLQTARDKRMLPLLFIAPVLQTIVFGFAIDLDLKDQPLVVADEDRTPTSRDLTVALENNDGFRVLATGLTSSQAEQEVFAGRAAMALLIPRNFEAHLAQGSAEVLVVLDGSDSNTALRAGQEPWTVSIPAEHAAMAALNDWRHIKKTRRVIEKERDRLLSDLRLLPGVEPFPGAANFIFVKIGSFDASLLVQKLGIRGLLVRDCSSFPGLDNGFVRISVRTGRENRRLIKVLRELLARPATGK